MHPGKLRGLFICGSIAASVALQSCGTGEVVAKISKASVPPLVAVAKVCKQPISRNLTISAELVPFQEIDVFAKESGYVKSLLVDYGSHVKAGQLMAVLEIPELQALLQEDQASIQSFSEQINNARHELSRVEAQHKVLHLQFARLNSVAVDRPGLVAQQEVDDSQGKDLAAEAQVDSAKSRLQVAQSELTLAQSKLVHDQALFAYSRITAPFSGVVTQRFANLGTLMQAGTSSSTQVLPLVKLAQEDRFRLTIPVPESYVRYVKVGDPVNVRVPSLDRDFPGTVARFSYDVTGATRTMHTEVDVPNPQGVLIPGVYAEASLALDRKGDALVIPLQGVAQEADHANVLIVDSNNTIQSRQIKLGIQTENVAEVLAGVQEGDEVVINDRSGLRVGEVVQPKLSVAASYQTQN